MRHALLLPFLVAASLADHAAGHAQSLFSPGSGYYISAVPLARSNTRTSGDIWALGGGIRYRDNFDIGIRAGRESTGRYEHRRIGRTIVEVPFNGHLDDDPGRGGLRLQVVPALTIEDHSLTVYEDLHRTRNEGGMRLTTIGARGELQRYWRLGDSSAVQFYPMVGLGLQHHLIRERETEFPDGRRDVSGRTTVTWPVLFVGIPVSLPIGTRRLTIEPGARAHTIFAPLAVSRTFQAVIAVHLAL